MCGAAAAMTILMIDPDPKVVDTINSMSRIEMARLWRFTPSGHPYFNTTLPYFEIFRKRFNELGGFSVAISKEIGWEQS